MDLLRHTHIKLILSFPEFLLTFSPVREPAPTRQPNTARLKFSLLTAANQQKGEAMMQVQQISRKWRLIPKQAFYLALE